MGGRLHLRGDLVPYGVQRVRERRVLAAHRRVAHRRGDLIAGLPVCLTNHPDCLPITHLHIKVLRRPLESAQYTSIRYTSRLADAGALASIGTVGDSFDNAMAESVIGLYKTECVRHEGPWRGVDDLELATLNWVWWFNEVRLHSEIGHVPPTELEANYYHHNNPQQQPLPGQPALH